MEKIYSNIVSDEIIISKEGDPDKRGWMKMQAGNLKEGKKFFLLKGNDLLWYKDVTLDGNNVPLRGKLTFNDHITTLPCVEQDSFKIYLYSTKQDVPITFQLFDKNRVVEHKAFKISLTCANNLTRDQWTVAFRKNILVSINPLLGSLQSTTDISYDDLNKRNTQSEEDRKFSMKKRNPLKTLSYRLTKTLSGKFQNNN